MQSLSKRFVLATLALGLALAAIPGAGTSFADHPALKQSVIEQSPSAPGCMRNPPPSQCKTVPGPSDGL